MNQKSTQEVEYDKLNEQRKKNEILLEHKINTLRFIDEFSLATGLRLPFEYSYDIIIGNSRDGDDTSSRFNYELSKYNRDKNNYMTRDLEFLFIDPSIEDTGKIRSDNEQKENRIALISLTTIWYDNLEQLTNYKNVISEKFSEMENIIQTMPKILGEKKEVLNYNISNLNQSFFEISDCPENLKSDDSAQYTLATMLLHIPVPMNNIAAYSIQFEKLFENFRDLYFLTYDPKYL